MKILKVEDEVLIDFEPKRWVPISYDEQGNPVEFQEVYVIDITKMKDYVKDTLIWLAKNKVQQKLDAEGFYSVGDLIAYKTKDETAKVLFDWYYNFDGKVWDWIENVLPTKTNEELLEIDLKALIEEFANGN